jgi:hypothetical protein
VVHPTNKELRKEIADTLRYHSHWLFAAQAFAIDARDRQEGAPINRDLVLQEPGQWLVDSVGNLDKKGRLQ